MKRKGFTLIELLVVITIIVILAAILFPVFAKAKERARQATCISNLKQIGMAVLMYADHYDDTYPPLWYYTPRLIGSTGEFTTTDGFRTWMDLVYTYTKDVNVFKCPDCMWNTAPPGGVGLAGFATAYGINDYGLNANPPQRFGLCGYGSSEYPLAGIIKSVSTSEISKAADTVMIADVAGPGEEVYPAGVSIIVSTVGAGGRIAPIDLDYNERFQYASSRHDRGSNIVYCDGHVKWMDQEAALAKLIYRAVKM